MKLKILLFLIIFLISCNTIRYNHQREDNYSPAIGKGIITNQIMLGMTHEQVIASWGKPYSLQVEKNGFVYCVYKLKIGKIHLYFENNRLYGIQREN